MAKISLTKPLSGYNLAEINNNFTKIEQEFQNKVLYRDNPIGEPNTLETDVDANGRSIYNVNNLSVNGALTVNVLEVEDLYRPFTTDVFSGTGSQTAFVLSENAGDVSNIDLAVGGVVQVPGLNFEYLDTVNTVNFLTGAPPSGTNNISVRYGQVLGTSTGGGGSTSLGGITIPNFSMNTSTPNDRIEFASTSPAGWNTSSGRMTVDLEFISNSYFSANPGGHVAFVLRGNPSLVSTAVSGNGAIFGDLTSVFFAGDEARFEPTTIIETWNTGATAGQRFLYPETTGPTDKPLLDGVRYRFIIESTISESLASYVRYRLYQWTGDTKKSWDLITDTGDTLVPPSSSDLTQQGFFIGQVFGEDLSAWSIDFSNVKIVWGPAGTIVSDQTNQMSKYGADAFGDINIRSLGKKIKFPFTAGPSLVDAFGFKSATPNTATTVAFLPNGSSTTANVLFSNNSTSASTYQIATVGMAGSEGLIETIGLSASNPNFGINIGVGNRVVTFSTAGESLAGNLDFTGVARRISAPTPAGPSLVDALTFQSSTLNAATTIVAKPNGTSTTSNILFSNNSTSSSTYQAATFGMAGSVGLIETFGLATSNPTIGINIGSGNRVATFSTAGLTLLGASEAIGNPIGYSATLGSLGGTNATTFSTTANVDWDVSWCAIGAISGFLGGSYNATNLEFAIRPIACLLSYLIKDLQDKKVI